MAHRKMAGPGSAKEHELIRENSDERVPNETGRQVETLESGGEHNNEKVPDSEIQGMKAGKRMRAMAEGKPKPIQQADR